MFKEGRKFHAVLCNGFNADENAKAGGKMGERWGVGWKYKHTHIYNLLGPFFALNRARENGESMFGKQQAFFCLLFSFQY